MAVALTVNAGSSSLKLAVFALEPDLSRRLSITVEHIGAEARLVVHEHDGADDAGARREPTRDEAVRADDHLAALRAATERAPSLLQVDAIGHRIVRGGPQQHQAVHLTDTVTENLRADAEIDPEHMPPALALIDELRAQLPSQPHIGCFDTAFHRTLPPVSQAYALPRRVTDDGVVRLGFHGLSCEHVVERLQALDTEAGSRRVIVAHLGGGASVTAIRQLQSVDTTMGFSPTGGLVMSTRCGDLDPSVVLHLLDRGHSANDIRSIVNRQSGLLGVSGVSGDMRTLLEREATMPEAAHAVSLFCHSVRKHVGAMAAVLGGLDVLVFTGGIGERAAVIRERVCAELGFLGIALDTARNAAHDATISTERSAATVRIIAADEERTIARHVRAVLAYEE